MDAEKLGKFIVELRRETGMTQAELAQKLQVTDKAVSRWERGVGLPDINTIEPLAEALGVGILEIMKAERIGENRLDMAEAANVVSDVIITAERQRRQERRQIFTAVISASLGTLVILLWDTMGMLGMLGVVLPSMCATTAVSLFVYGVIKRSRRATVFAGVLTGVIVFFVLLLFLVGMFGLGPVPK